MTTRLEILNAMLAVNGETPVSSTDSTDPAAIQANNVLTNIDRKVQLRGWWFNKEVMVLNDNVDGEVILPQNTLSVDPVDTRSAYVRRGTRLYDKKNNTFVISDTVKVEVVVQLDISDMPESASMYLMDKAVKEYYIDDDGDETKVRRLSEREAESYAYLQREHLANSDTNIRNSTLGLKLLHNTTQGKGVDIDRGA